MFGMRIRAALLAAPMLVFAVAGSPHAFAATLFFQGFESNSDNVYGVTRVPSGTNSVTSATGGYHAEAPTALQGVPTFSYTDWGAYNNSIGGSAGAFQPYTTSIDIYLNPSAGAANDTRFDFSSAINNPSGSFLQDFVFNAGFYDSSHEPAGPGAGTDRFIISASNNANRDSSNPDNPGRNPVAISTSGWYTFQTEFVDNGGFLNGDMSILDSLGILVASWVLDNDTSHPISGVGGNRYGWIVNNEFDFLAIDNASLTTTPLPATLPMFASGLGVLGLLRWRRKRKSVAAAV
jgi:PEP-CTERM motif